MRAERPLALPAERALQQGAEDGRLDPLPVEVARGPQQLELVGLEVDLRRRREQPSVGVRRTRVEPVLRPWRGLGQVAEESTELIDARSTRVGDQRVQELREQLAREDLEVLGEHRPDRLEHEVAQRSGVRGAALAQAVVEVGDEHDGLSRELRLVGDEDRLASGEEGERVEVLGELGEVEGRPRLGVHSTRLPDLEAVKGAQHDVGGSALTRGPRALPVPQRLGAVGLEPVGLARALHLEDADSGPHHVDEAAVLCLLESYTRVAARGPVALEEAVEEGLRLGSLRASVATPLGGELPQATANLLTGERHVSA